MASWNASGATGIKRLEQFPAATAKRLASKGWLPDSKYLVILANQEQYMPDLSRDAMPTLATNALSIKLTEESLFLCPKDLEDYAEYEYVLNETVYVQIKQRDEMVLTRSSSLELERREYTLWGCSSYKLVHYSVPDSETTNRVNTILAVKRLQQGVEQFSISADERKNKVTAKLSGAGSSAAAAGGDNYDYEEYFEEE